MEIKYQARHPVQFTERLLRNIGKISNKTVIVIRDWWTAVELAKDNRVLFITDSADARDLFEQVVCRNRAFGNDDEVLFINNWQMDLLFSKESDGKKKKQKRKTWEEILSKCEKDWPMNFQYCIVNPPYDIGNKIINQVKECLTDDGKAVVIQPLGQYKQQKLFEHIEKFELSDPKLFEGAVITENLNISVVTKNKQNKFTWQELVLESCEQNFRKFYDWNIAHNREIAMCRKDSKSNTPIAGVSIDNDFVESGRCVSVDSGAGFGQDSYGYLWNVTKQNTNTGWLHCAGIIHFNSKRAKDNFAKFWYSDIKGKSLISRVALGVKMTSVSADYYFFIPQIDWETIDQHTLWNTDVDAAVLDTMDLKWNEDKTKIIDK